DEAVEAQALGLGCLSFVGVTGEALVELGQPSGQLGPAHVDPGGSDLEAGAQIANCGQPLVQTLSRRPQGREALCASSFLGLELGQEGFQFGDPSGLPPDALDQLVEVETN